MAKKKTGFLRDLMLGIGDEESSIAADGLGSAEFTGCIDTGSYALNALISGSIHGGVPNNKVIAFAGESATGKTYFVLGIAKHFLDTHPDAGVIYYDTEAAVTKEMMESRGIDTTRVMIVEPLTIQHFRTHALKLIDAYLASDTKPPLMMVLDSLGALSTNKEMGDIAEGSDTRDMTRSQLIRGCFRVIRLKLAKAKIPMLVTNHTYAGIGQYAVQQNISGGGGIKYASDDIIMLSKAKDKEGTEVVGVMIRAKTYKSRHSRENQEVIVKLSYATGLDRYFGLRVIAEKGGVIRKDGVRYVLPDGRKIYGKELDDSPALIDLFINDIEAAAVQQFRYQAGAEPIVVDDVLVTQDGEVVD